MKPLVAHLTDGPGDPSSTRVAGCLPSELRYAAFAGSSLVRTERIYKRVGAVLSLSDHDEARYRFVREAVVHGG